MAIRAVWFVVTVGLNFYMRFLRLSKLIRTILYFGGLPIVVKYTVLYSYEFQKVGLARIAALWYWIAFWIYLKMKQMESANCE